MAKQVGQLRLNGTIRLATAERLAKQLHDGLADRDVAIDATHVVEVDAATLQVLVSAKETAAQRGRSLTVAFAPGGGPEMLARRLCLSGALGLDAAAAPAPSKE